MLTNPARVFDDLPDKLQQGLISRCGLDLTTLDKASLTRANPLDAGHKRLRDALSLIKALTDTDAIPLVNRALSDIGWSLDDFNASANALIRAAELYLLDDAGASDTARYWSANKRYWSASQMSAFGITPQAMPDQDAIDYARRFEGVLKTIVEKHFSSSEVIEIKWHVRPKTGLDFAGGAAIQIDVKRSNAPVTVEVEENGRAVQLSLKFLSDISILVLSDVGEIAIVSKEGGHRFRKELAESTRQILFHEGGEIEDLRPRKIDVYRLRSKPHFQYDPRELAVPPRVVGLSYRRPETQSVRVTLRADEAADIYSTQEIKSLSDTTRLFRALIEFEFRPHFAVSDTRTRVAELKEPHFQSYPHFTHEERLSAMAMFTRMGLIDPGHEAVAAYPFEELERLTGPIVKSEAYATFGPDMTETLIRTSILKPDEPGDRAWCDICLKTHPIRVEGGSIKLACRHEEKDVPVEALETVVFEPRNLATWLMKTAGSKRAQHANFTAEAWGLGECEPEGYDAPVELVFATGLQHAAIFNALREKLLTRSDIKAGLVIALDARGLGDVFVGPWHLTSLSTLVSLRRGKLSLSSQGIANILLGRIAATSKPAMNWDDFFEIFQAENPGGGPYEVARKLSDEHRNRWPRTIRTLANRLEKKFPNRFP
jgi:hypothetical protein